MIRDANQMRDDIDNLKHRLDIQEAQMMRLLNKLDLNNYVSLYSMEDAVEAIDGLNPDNPNDEEKLYSISHFVGMESGDWGYDFDDAKIELITAAKKAGFDSEFLPANIDNAMIEGVAHYNEENNCE